MQNELVDSLNELLQGPIDWLFNAGPIIMFPIIIIIMGLIFRQSLSKSIRSGILIGIGFIGIFTFAFDVFMGKIGPATAAFVENTGVKLTAIDAGWGLASSITWAMPTAFGVIVVCFVVNLIMLALGNRTVTVAGKTIHMELLGIWVYCCFNLRSNGTILRYASGLFVSYALCCYPCDNGLQNI